VIFKKPLQSHAGTLSRMFRYFFARIQSSTVMAIPNYKIIAEATVLHDVIQVPGARKRLLPAAGSSSPMPVTSPKDESNIQITISPLSFLVDAFWLIVFAIASIIEGIVITITVGIFLSVMFVVGIIAVIIQSVALIFVVHIAIGLIIAVLGFVVVAVAIMTYLTPSNE
jgi:hypothetical protein